MKRQALVLIVALFLSGIRFPVYAQRSVVITIGQPNIWSLEQAHYLLSRMRSENLLLRDRAPNANDLDPNAINGARIQTLKVLLDISAALDQPLGRTNSLISSDQRFNQKRRQDLSNRMDSLYSDLDKETTELATLKVERERMNTDNTDDATKKLKDAEITAATARQDVTNQRLKATSDELSKLSSTTGNLAGPTLSDNNSRVMDAITDQLLKDKDLVSNDARLSASTVLDNHIQMQYEMIAKQLTLLRDEVGPGERLVFLELPASFYTTPGKAEEKIAQVWWQIDGYRTVDEYTRENAELDQLRSETERLYAGGRLTRLEWIDAQSKIDIDRAALRDKEVDRNEQNRQRILQGGLRPRFAVTPTPTPTPTGSPTPTPTPTPTPPATASPTPTPEPFWTGTPGEVYVPLGMMDQRWRHVVRTIDLIPRQSSLNVNDIQDTIKAGRVSAAFSFLFGFGAKVSYQRQRELYEQYLHQEIFASGFGKGEQTFGWTYGPTPGTKRIAPGLRTSYAVLVVPDTATMLRLKARSCYFPRTAYSPDDYNQTEFDSHWTDGLNQKCVGNNNQVFDVPIPNSRDNNFWLTEIRYKPVAPGQRTVVFLHGENISAQTGVLVNGTPLRPSVGVAQPDLNSASLEEDILNAPDTAVAGYYELINRNQMALVFKMPKDFKGTPLITLVSPGRGRIINYIPLRINSGDIQTLDDAPQMFATAAPSPVLSITDLQILTIKQTGSDLDVLANLSGSMFSNGDQIKINGRAPIGTPELIGDGLYQLRFKIQPEDQTLNFIIQNGENNAQKSFSKPVTINIVKFDVLKYEPPGEKTKGSITIHLEGAGFDNSLSVSLNGAPVAAPDQFIVVSPTKAVLVVKDPPETMLITIQNSVTKATSSVLVVRPDKPKEPATKERKPEQ